MATCQVLVGRYCSSPSSSILCSFTWCITPFWFIFLATGELEWAFKEGEEEKHPHLVNIGKEIVKKCIGVPLALRTLGSSLFSKFEASEWEYVRENEIWNMPQRRDDILPALKLSYDLMPSYLRQCFALFSLFPKDYEFYSFEMT